MVLNAIEVANKIIAGTDIEKGELISNLKLQKLLYYAQGFNLAVFGDPLFNEPIEAWQYGPVVRQAYNHFKEFGSGALSILDSDNTIAIIEGKQLNIFNQVMNIFGKFSAIQLMHMTHEELPWKSVFTVNPQGEIGHDILIEYFKTRVSK